MSSWPNGRNPHKAQYVTCIFHAVLVWRFHFATAATIGRWIELQKRLSRDTHSKNFQFTAIILNFQQYVVILALGTCFINRNISSVSNSNHPRWTQGTYPDYHTLGHHPQPDPVLLFISTFTFQTCLVMRCRGSPNVKYWR